MNLGFIYGILNMLQILLKSKRSRPISGHPIVIRNVAVRKRQVEFGAGHATTNQKLTCGSNTVTIKDDPSRTPTVATSSNRTFFAPGLEEADAAEGDGGGGARPETRTGSSSRGVTRPLARASSRLTSRWNHSTQAAIFASARAYSSRAAGCVSACCEPGVREAVETGARFEPVDDDGGSSDSASVTELRLPPPFWWCFGFVFLEAYARVRVARADDE